MKNGGIFRRARYSLNGLRIAVQEERSFRAHLAFSMTILIAMIALGPEPFWWAVLLLAIATCWGFELVNAAIERLCDHLNPDRHPAIGAVKDLASAAAFTTNAVTAILAITAVMQSV